MVKKALNLQQLIELSKTLENMIATLQYTIIANNASLKSFKGDKIDVIKAYDKLNLAWDQLAIIKLAKHTANSKKTKLKVSNQELIFELYNLGKKKSLLTTLFKDKHNTRKGGKQNQYEHQLTKVNVDDQLIEIDERIKEIKKTMTEFNTSHTVKVKFHEELELL